MKKLTEIIFLKEKSSVSMVEQLGIIKIIDDNKKNNPDASIEACRSLIEGIAKTIIVFLDKAGNAKTVEKLGFRDLIQKMFDNIQPYEPTFEIDFTEKSAELIKRISDIRHKRGPISHGKIYPKEETSSPILAEFIISTTEALLIYVLTSFYAIDFSQHLPVPYESNSDYNNSLDEQYPDLGIIYSKALYDQDYVQYKQQLLDYNYSKE